MYKIKWADEDGKEKEIDCVNLDNALKEAIKLNQYVLIKSGDFELVGIFGVDSISNGVCPDGVEYDWVKRRTKMVT